MGCLASRDRAGRTARSRNDRRRNSERGLPVDQSSALGAGRKGANE